MLLCYTFEAVVLHKNKRKIDEIFVLSAGVEETDCSYSVDQHYDGLLQWPYVRRMNMWRPVSTAAVVWLSVVSQSDRQTDRETGCQQVIGKADSVMPVKTEMQSSILTVICDFYVSQYCCYVHRGSKSQPNYTRYDCTHRQLQLYIHPICFIFETCTQCVMKILWWWGHKLLPTFDELIQSVW